MLQTESMVAEIKLLHQAQAAFNRLPSLPDEDHV